MKETKGQEKKSLLFVCYGLGIGGIEKCLVNLLNILPEEEYDVDILLMNPEYEMRPQIRRNITEVDAFDYVMNIEDTPAEIRRRGGFLHNIRKTLAYVDFRVRIKFGWSPWKIFRPLERLYDVAIAYSQNGFGPYYVIDGVQAKRKVLWYHNGAYEKTGVEFNRDSAYFTQFDQVVAVSHDCCKMLEKTFPFERDQLLLLHNICDREDILLQAESFIPESFTHEWRHIVTVGRMTREKGADLALDACEKLVKAGYPVCWHWIGDGNQRKRIEEQIREKHLENRFILEGNQTNPYPYVRCAEVYVQSSYYEAYSTTITEAKILCRTIVTTDVGGMREQLIDGVSGLIVPVAAEAIAVAVRRVLDEPELSSKFACYLEQEDYSSDRFLEEYRRTVLA